MLVPDSSHTIAMEEANDMLQRQALQQEVSSLHARVERLTAMNADLSAKCEKSDKDTHEFVTYFEKEMS